MPRIAVFLIAVAALVSGTSGAFAHHVLGRPAYALNEDSNTPPAMQVETWVGNYDFNYMVFPAFPRPGEPGRINLYVRRIDGGNAFNGKITFTVQDDSWRNWIGLGAKEETLGVQAPDDVVFRQGFVFKNAGDYLITARFEADGEPYIIDFPLRIGARSPLGPLGVILGLLGLTLVGVNLLQRRRAMSGKIRASHEKS